MIGRRAAFSVGVAIAARWAAAALPVPPGRRLAFRLIRYGSEIGRHSLTFERRDDALTVHVAVDALVSFISIPIVRYTHRVAETWQGGILAGLSGETNKNGQREWVNAGRTSEGLVVLGSRTSRYIAPDAACGTSYWNKRMLDGPMISLEDGVLLRPKVVMSGDETIRLASGSPIEAHHYNLSGEFDVDLWYDQSDTWVGMSFTVADGSNVHYERE